jgi:hypothetical protein
MTCKLMTKSAGLDPVGDVCPHDFPSQGHSHHHKTGKRVHILPAEGQQLFKRKIFFNAETKRHDGLHPYPTLTAEATIQSNPIR